jgi:hypothetical protein
MDAGLVQQVAEQPTNLSFIFSRLEYQNNRCSRMARVKLGSTGQLAVTIEIDRNNPAIVLLLRKL